MERQNKKGDLGRAVLYEDENGWERKSVIQRWNGKICCKIEYGNE